METLPTEPEPDDAGKYSYPVVKEILPQPVLVYEGDEETTDDGW